MKTRILGVALALAFLTTAASASTFTFTNATAANVTEITNLLSALPAEYAVDAPRPVNPEFDPLFGAARANVSTLTDGQAPLADGAGTFIGNALNQFGVVEGDVLTYSLGGSFNLTKVEIYNAWSDGGRDDFNNVTIEFSTNGTDYVNLVTELSTLGDNDGSVVVNSGVSADGDVIAAGATHVRFTFNGLENGAIGISELAVQGTSAVPEPSTYAAILGAVVLGAAVYRRRSARA